MSDSRDQSYADLVASGGLPEATEPLLDLKRELAGLLNSHSAENASDTPDYLLAEFLLRCLNAYEQATQGRDAWYGMNPRPGCSDNDPWAAAVPEVPRERTITPWNL